MLLVLAGLNWGFVAIFKIDAISSLFGKSSIFSKIFFVLIAICAIYVGINRDSYLPFLGQSVLPCSVLTEKIPAGAELKVRIIAPAGHKVIYWAAEPSVEKDAHALLHGWKEAYGEFENSGVAIAEADGSALLQVRRPQPYWVPPGAQLEPHVHYRICSKNGMIGPVRSLFIEERVEGFGSAVEI